MRAFSISGLRCSKKDRRGIAPINAESCADLRILASGFSRYSDGIARGNVSAAKPAAPEGAAGAALVNTRRQA